MSPGLVSKVIAALGVSRRRLSDPAKTDPQLRQRIHDIYLSGKSIIDTANEARVSKHTVEQVLKEDGIGRPYAVAIGMQGSREAGVRKVPRFTSSVGSVNLDAGEIEERVSRLRSRPIPRELPLPGPDGSTSRLTLTLPQRVVLVLAYRAGMNGHHIAKRMGITVYRVYSHLHAIGVRVKHNGEWFVGKGKGRERVEPVDGMSICCLCNAEKPIKEFVQSCNRKSGKTYYAHCLSCMREKRLRQTVEKFGITMDEYRRMFERQQGRCAICREAEIAQGKTRLAIDHDHGTGRVRGLLCLRCNKGGGLYGEDPTCLRAAADYFEHS